MSLKTYCEENKKQRILKEWDAEKNLPLTPDNVAPSSSFPVWWRCENGHSWCTQVRSRAKSSTGCPICREEKLAAKRQRRLEEARTKHLSGRTHTANSKKQKHQTEVKL